MENIVDQMEIGVGTVAMVEVIQVHLKNNQNYH